MIAPGFVTKTGAIVQGRTEGGESKPHTLATAGIRPGKESATVPMVLCSEEILNR